MKTGMSLIESFEYKNRTCVITKIIYEKPFPLDDFYCGYVSLMPESGQLSHRGTRLHSVELVFSGIRSTFGQPKHIWFFGFDTGHAYNTENPWTNTQEAINEKIQEMADELIWMNI